MPSRKKGKKAPRRETAAEQGSKQQPAPQNQWVIRFDPSVERVDLSQVGHAAFDIAKRAIDKKLKVGPKEYGTNLHHPLHGLYKLKASHVRIAYHVQDTPREVWVLMIGDRKNIWESEQAEILARFEAEMGRHIIRQRTRPK